MVLMLPNAYSHCLFTVTVSNMKTKSAHAFMCAIVVVVVSSRFYVCDGGGGGGVCVCLCLCLCAWSGWFLLQSPEMKLAFLLQFISR